MSYDNPPRSKKRGLIDTDALRQKRRDFEAEQERLDVAQEAGVPVVQAQYDETAMHSIDDLRAAVKAEESPSFSDKAPKVDVFSVADWRSMLEELRQDPELDQKARDIAVSTEKDRKKREAQKGFDPEDHLNDAGFDQTTEGFVDVGQKAKQAEQQWTEWLADLDADDEPMKESRTPEKAPVDTGFSNVSDYFDELPVAPDLPKDDALDASSLADDDEPTRISSNDPYNLEDEPTQPLEQVTETSGPRDGRTPRENLKIAQADVAAQVAAREAAKNAPAPSDKKPPLRMPEQSKKQTSWFGKALRRFGMALGLAAAFQGDQDQGRVEAAVQQQAVENTASTQIVQSEITLSEVMPAESAPVIPETTIADESVEAVQQEQEATPDVSKVWIQKGEGVSQAIIGAGYEIAAIKAALQLPVTIGAETRTLANVFVDAKGGELGMIVTEAADGTIENVQFYTGDASHVLSPTELASVMHFTSSEGVAVHQAMEAPKKSTTPEAPAVEGASQTAEPSAQVAPDVRTTQALVPDVPPAPAATTERSPKNPEEQNSEQLVAKKTEDEDEVIDERVAIEQPRAKVETLNPARQLSAIEDALDDMVSKGLHAEIEIGPLSFSLKPAAADDEYGDVQVRHRGAGFLSHRLTPRLIEAMGIDLQAALSTDGTANAQMQRATQITPAEYRQMLRLAKGTQE